MTRYWQRYCGKNDTIGFFGPVSWLYLDPQAPAVRAVPGPGSRLDGLVRHGVVDVEWRALDALATALAADPRYGPWLPVARQPHLHVDGRQLYGAGARPVTLTAAQAALLAGCAEVRPAAQVVAHALAQPGPDSARATVKGEAERYLAARRWRARLGLPERVFARVGTEVKPVYVDFTGPAYVAAFAAMVRVAHRKAGPDTPVVVSELLPGPGAAWLSDVDGRRFLSAAEPIAVIGPACRVQVRRTQVSARTSRLAGGQATDAVGPAKAGGR